MGGNFWPGKGNPGNQWKIDRLIEVGSGADGLAWAPPVISGQKKAVTNLRPLAARRDAGDFITRDTAIPPAIPRLDKAVSLMVFRA